jgi:hypothetical protein
MNSLIVTADRLTQLKIVLVAFAASMLFIAVGLTGRIPADRHMRVDASAVVSPIERIEVTPIAPSAKPAPDGSV